MQKYNVGSPVEGDSYNTNEYSSIDKQKTYEQYKNDIPDIKQVERNKFSLPEVKPGETVYCLLCGQPMHYPKDFSSDPKIAQREFKWQCHSNCMKLAELQCDKATPGIMREREEEQKKMEKYKIYRERKSAMGFRGV